MSFKLLRHPKPYRNESLANYFFRLSQENCCDVSWILQEFGFKNIASKINFIESKDLIKKIAHSTKLTTSEVMKMTVNNFSMDYKRRDRKFIEKHLTKKTYYCPLCLKDKYYQRIYWTYDSIKICLEHGTILINRCQKCNSAISTKSLITGFCSCGFNFESATSSRCDELKAVNNQAKLFWGLNLIKDVEIGQALKNITRIEYIKLFDLLEEILKPFDNHKFFVNRYYKRIEQILRKWPSEFYYALENYVEYFRLHLKNKPRFLNSQSVWSAIYLIKEEYNMDFLSKELNNFSKWYTSDRISNRQIPK